MSIECVLRPTFMKVAVFLLFPLATFSVSGSTKATDIGFRSIVDLGGSEIYSLNTEEESAWVEVGDVFAGYEIVTFKADEKVLLLRKDGEEYSVSLGTGGISRADIDSEDADVHMTNLRRVAQSGLIFAHDNDDQLPGGDDVESIHDVARLLALRAGLNDASSWIAGGDARSGMEESLTTVLNETRQGLDPHFAAQDVVAIDFATNLTMDMRSTTPIAWTRGLREDGTWDERGAFGSSGGFVVFLGGNVARYSDLSEGDFIRRPDGTRTVNILEALPPEAEVVGSGPASLNGSTGSGGEPSP